MAVSIFNRPKRQILPTVLAAQRQFPCESYSDCLAAITEIASAGGSGDYKTAGFAIVQTGPWDVTAPIIIPAACIGLTISAVARVPITASGIVSSLFDVRAPLVTIRNLFVSSESVTDMFTAFVILGASTTKRLHVLFNDVVADRLYVETASFTSSSAQIHGNEHSRVNLTASAAVVLHGTSIKCSHNNLSDGGGDTITLGSGGSRNTIVGNDLGGGDYTSTASGGLNTFSSNTNVGTVTAHATDNTTGGNTA